MDKNLLLNFILEEVKNNDNKDYLMLFERSLKFRFEILKGVRFRNELEEKEYQKLKNLFVEDIKLKQSNKREEFIIKDIFKKRNINNNQGNINLKQDEGCKGCEFFIICKSLGLLKKQENCNKDGEINLIYDILFNKV